MKKNNKEKLKFLELLNNQSEGSKFRVVAELLYDIKVLLNKKK